MKGTCRLSLRLGTHAILSLTVSMEPPSPRTAAGMNSSRVVNQYRMVRSDEKRSYQLCEICCQKILLAFYNFDFLEGGLFKFTMDEGCISLFHFNFN